MKDYYGILEVNEKASQEIIEKAYKTLAKKYHPDLYSSVEKREAEKKMKDINEAYNIISNSFLRTQYDLELQKERTSRQVNKDIYENDVQEYQQSNKEKENQFIPKNREEKQKTEHVPNNSNVGTIFGIIDLVKVLWTNKPKSRQKRKINQNDWIAVGLTIVAVLIIGGILWVIPFTNSWMRQLLFENPIFDFIGGLFS